MVYLDQTDSLVRKDHQGLLVPREIEEHLDSRVPLERRVSLV